MIFKISSTFVTHRRLSTIPKNLIHYDFVNQCESANICKFKGGKWKGTHPDHTPSSKTARGTKAFFKGKKKKSQTSIKLEELKKKKLKKSLAGLFEQKSKHKKWQRSSDFTQSALLFFKLIELFIFYSIW